MLDAKFHGRHSWPEVELVESVIVVAFLQEGAVSRLGEIGFVVQQMQDANRLLGNQTNYRLVILLLFQPIKKRRKRNVSQRVKQTYSIQMTHCPFFYFLNSYRERDGLPLDSLFGVLLLL
jgi:hypothetical protein